MEYLSDPMHRYRSGSLQREIPEKMDSRENEKEDYENI
jgi:hypothetical protein